MSGRHASRNLSRIWTSSANWLRTLHKLPAFTKTADPCEHMLHIVARVDMHVLLGVGPTKSDDKVHYEMMLARFESARCCREFGSAVKRPSKLVDLPSNAVMDGTMVVSWSSAQTSWKRHPSALPQRGGEETLAPPPSCYDRLEVRRC